jgi:glycosyltransferase involved in cell wall biosynthesis
MMRPKVSVVLPYFNAEKTLLRAARSILDQTYPNLELLLVNNCSTDGSEQIAQQLAQMDKRVVLLTEIRQGVSFAANTGNSHASGQYIARMDADDFSHSTRLEKQLTLLEAKTDIGVAACQVAHVAHNLKTAGLAKYVAWTNSLLTPEQIFYNRFVEAPIVNPTAMFRRDLIERHGGFLHGEFPEDYELWLRWLDVGVRMEKVPEVLFDWYDSETRLTRTDSRYSTQAFYTIKSKYLAKHLSEMHPAKPIWVWGAGRVSRQRIKLLQQYGIIVQGYIDVKQRDTGNLPCLPFDTFHWNQDVFILSYVANWRARERICDFLQAKGKTEVIDYILVA